MPAAGARCDNLTVKHVSKGDRSKLAGHLAVQVRAEAQRVFGDRELRPSREAAESLEYTLSCLKVPILH